MAPNANGRTSPTSVVDLTPIITVGVRDYDLDITIDMFRGHIHDQGGDYGCYWIQDIFTRLNRLREGGTVVWIPDCNSGEFLDIEEWFTRYGFAPDMVIPGAYVDVEAERLDPANTDLGLHVSDGIATATDDGINFDVSDFDEHTETTASVTLGSQDTDVSELTADDKWEDIKKNGFKTEEYAYPLPDNDEEFEIDLESIDSWELNMKTSNDNRG